MNKTAIVLSEVGVGALIGCIPDTVVILVLPYLYLWIKTLAILHDMYEEHLRDTLRFDATAPISITVAVVPFFFGMAICAEF